MNSSLYKKKQKLLLASILRCNPKEIEYLCDHIDSFYDKWIELKKDKTTGQIKLYPDGTPKQRIIRPSHLRLKRIQKSIHLNILSKITLPDNVQGGVKNKSNITNGKVHQGNKYQFSTDLQEFFPNISHKKIFALFLKLGYSNYIAHWLTKLTSIEFELPQGTPTSTAIANLVFLETDYKLIKLSKINNLTYTRFVDDLTFSSPLDFRISTNSILNIVRNDGFNINYRKTKYEGDQCVTGVYVFNNYIDAPSKIKERARSENAENPTSIKPYNTYLHNIRRTNKNINNINSKIRANQ